MPRGFFHSLVWDYNLSCGRDQEAVVQVEPMKPASYGPSLQICALHLYLLMWDLFNGFLALVLIASLTHMASPIASRKYVQAVVFSPMGPLIQSLSLLTCNISENLKRLDTQPSEKFGCDCLVGSKIICKMKRWGRREHSDMTWLHMLHSIKRKRKKQHAKGSMQEAETPSLPCQAVPQRTCSL